MRLSPARIEITVSLLRTQPIVEVRWKTGLTYLTLARLAKIHLDQV